MKMKINYFRLDIWHIKINKKYDISEVAKDKVELHHKASQSNFFKILIQNIDIVSYLKISTILTFQAVRFLKYIGKFGESKNNF